MPKEEIKNIEVTRGNTFNKIWNQLVKNDYLQTHQRLESSNVYYDLTYYVYTVKEHQTNKRLHSGLISGSLS